MPSLRPRALGRGEAGIGAAARGAAWRRERLRRRRGGSAPDRRGRRSRTLRRSPPLFGGKSDIGQRRRSAGSGRQEIEGFAPRELEAAAAALRSAYARRDRGAVTLALADLAIAATDLADPFQVTGLDQPEVLGARAAFSDLLAGALPAELDVRESAMTTDPVVSGVALAEASAGFRQAIERAFESGDEIRLEELRRERLEAAVGLARTIAYEAWRSAGEPALGADMNIMHVWPNPVRSEAQTSFTIPVASAARMELFDLAGRRVWSKALGQLTPGTHTASIPAGAMRPLPPGVYLVRVIAPQVSLSGRLTYQGR